MVKLKSLGPVAVGAVTLTVVVVVFTGHGGWLTAPLSTSGTTSLAARTIKNCPSGPPVLDDRSVSANGHWTRRTLRGQAASGQLSRKDRKALEVAAENSPPPPNPTPQPTCADSIDQTITYTWRYQERDVIVTVPMFAATSLPIELELERLATKLD